MFDWNWNQAKAAGRHVASYAAGGVTALVAFHFLSPQQGTDINGNITQIVSGLEQVSKGIAGILAIVVPIYTAMRSANSASPQNQVKSIVQNMTPTEIAQTATEVDHGAKTTLIEAVSKLDEVEKVITDKKVADATPDSPKVVAS